MSISNGADFYIRWSDFNTSGADDAMGIDDFEIYVRNCDEVVLLSSSTTGMNNECSDGGWTYIGNSTGKYFAIKKNGNTFTSTLDINVGSTISKTSSNGANQEHGMFLMGRYWNLTINSGSITSPVDIRFFYNPTELAAAKTARDISYAALPGTTLAVINSNTAEWFTNTNGVPFDASYITSIVGNKFPNTIQKWATPTISTHNGVTYVELTGINSFSGGTGGYSYGPLNGSGANSLPVTWASFEGSYDDFGNKLTWSTASEFNSSHFIVERSLNGKEYLPISENIKAVGNSNLVNTYSYIDKTNNPISYYRIKQIDLESNFDYSKTIVVKTKVKKESPFITSVFPTRINQSEEINIEIFKSFEGINTATIYDMIGKEMNTISTLESIFKMNISNLNTGIYFIKLSSGLSSKTYRLVR